MKGALYIYHYSQNFFVNNTETFIFTSEGPVVVASMNRPSVRQTDAEHCTLSAIKHDFLVNQKDIDKQTVVKSAKTEQILHPAISTYLLELLLRFAGWNSWKQLIPKLYIWLIL